MHISEYGTMNKSTARLAGRFEVCFEFLSAVDVIIPPKSEDFKKEPKCRPDGVRLQCNLFCFLSTSNISFYMLFLETVLLSSE